MKYILVTGGAGNVGSALVKSLIKNPEYYVVVADNLSTGSKEKLPSHIAHQNFKFINNDVNKFEDISSVFYSYRFDYVFHYAAMVGVKRTLANPIGVLNDIDGIKNILFLSKNAGVKRVFYSSSSEVYGEPVEYPQNEYSTPLNSKLPYAIVKNVGEAFFRSYEKEYGLAYTVFRFFNTYGPDQSTDFVIPKFLHAAINHQDISIYGDGSQTRTFCYIDDNIEACMKIFENDLCVNDTINIGNNVEVTIYQLAERMIKATNSNSRIIHLPALKEGDMTRRQPDITKMKSILQRELVSVDEGIMKILSKKFEFTDRILSTIV